VKPEEVREVLFDALRYALNLIPEAPSDFAPVFGSSVFREPVVSVHHRHELEGGVVVDAHVKYHDRDVVTMNIGIRCDSWVEYDVITVYGRSYANIIWHYAIEDLFTWEEDRLTSEMREEKEKFVRFVECWRRFRGPADRGRG